MLSHGNLRSDVSRFAQTPQGYVQPGAGYPGQQYGMEFAADPMINASVMNQAIADMQQMGVAPGTMVSISMGPGAPTYNVQMPPAGQTFAHFQPHANHPQHVQMQQQMHPPAHQQVPMYAQGPPEMVGYPPQPHMMQQMQVPQGMGHMQPGMPPAAPHYGGYVPPPTHPGHHPQAGHHYAQGPPQRHPGQGQGYQQGGPGGRPPAAQHPYGSPAHETARPAPYRPAHGQPAEGSVPVAASPVVTAQPTPASVSASPSVSSVSREKPMEGEPEVAALPPVATVPQVFVLFTVIQTLLPFSLGLSVICSRNRLP